jgi:hypothetical protein
MTAHEVGTKLVELIGKNDFETIYSTLYSPAIQSIEADGKTADGMEGVNAKNAMWAETMEMHDWKVEGPFPHGDSFGLLMEMDVTEKASGNRFPIRELAIYDVEDGKIVRERFFYAM